MQLFIRVVGRGGVVPRHWDVSTTQGIVRGYYKPNPPHFTFLGVPYARSPTGYDRFKAPEPLLAWDGIFEATYQVKCPQSDLSGTEDCLVVNIFIPAVNQTDMPVIMHFHDGHFQSGWGAFHAPPHFLEQDIIVVTFNHRLGAPGFLCLRTPGIQGNAGLKDQIAALYWVQRNIAQFRGNPTDVTVYGTGSGAVSTELLLLSGASDQLFQKAILESGSVLAPSSMTYNPILHALDAAKELGYKGDEDLNNLQTFFQKISIYKLVNASTKWLPCLEKNSKQALIHTDPLHALSNGNFRHIPMMLVYSHCKQIDVVENNKARFRTIPENFDPLLPNNLDIDNMIDKQKVGKYTKNFYFHNSETPEDVLRSFIDYVNDVFIEYPLVKSAAYYAYKNIHPVFLMKFTYKMRNESLSWEARHGDIFQFVFKDLHWENPKNIVAHILRTMWINFIKVGDPTPITTAVIPEVWALVTPQIVDGTINYRKISYLNFGRNIHNKKISTQQFKFWDHIYNKFYKHYSN
ncbi:unnamed protein product [Colias eurytheme]|nr:unnamed protein product [Colias eurytheme]